MNHVYITRNPRYNTAWGGGNGAIRALHEHAHANGATVTDELPQAVVVMGLDGEDGHPSLEQVLRHREVTGSPYKVILRVNDCDARKGTVGVDERLVKASALVDGTIFVSNWIDVYFRSRGWACRNNRVIWNGVDGSVFNDTHRRVPNLGDPTRIVSHHWSDNALKSGEITQKLDKLVGKHPDRFKFTFIGRTKLSLPHSIVIPPLHGIELGKALADNDVYVSESKWDPGPNHISEGRACGMPVLVHEHGGGCVEFANYDNVYLDWDDLEFMLLKRQYVLQSPWNRSWSDFSRDVYDFVKETVDGVSP